MESRPSENNGVGRGETRWNYRGTQHNAGVNIGLADQRDDPTVDGPAGLGPKALDDASELVDRTGIAALADHLVDAGGAEAGVLGQGVADERQIGVEGAGSIHAGAAGSRLVLDGGADRLTVEAELSCDGPYLPVLAVVQAPDLGALRGRDHRPSFPARREARVVRGQPPARPAADHAPRGCGHRGGVRDGKSVRWSGCGGSVIRHAATHAVGALPVAMVETSFRTALMAGLGSVNRPATSCRPTRWRAVGMAAVARHADGEGAAALTTGSLAEGLVQGVGARGAISDWTTSLNRGTTAGTGLVCRSSGRSRGSGWGTTGPSPRV